MIERGRFGNGAVCGMFVVCVGGGRVGVAERGEWGEEEKN